MDVTLSPEIGNLIASEVRTGKFRSAGDFLAAAVEHHVLARDLGAPYTRNEVEEKIARGHRLSKARRWTATERSSSSGPKSRIAATFEPIPTLEGPYDVREICAYILEDSPAAATRTLDEFDRAFALLARSPASINPLFPRPSCLTE